jgi:hypothetical protein
MPDTTPSGTNKHLLKEVYDADQMRIWDQITGISENTLQTRSLLEDKVLPKLETLGTFQVRAEEREKARAEARLAIESEVDRKAARVGATVGSIMKAMWPYIIMALMAAGGGAGVVHLASGPPVQVEQRAEASPTSP